MKLIKKEFQELIKDFGWKIDTYNMDFGTEACELYYDWENPLLEISKGEQYIRVMVIGDIRIYGKRDALFEYRGGKAKGELTYWLRKNGQWENNNWFEIFYTDESGVEDSSIDDVYFHISEVAWDILHKIGVDVSGL